MKAFTSYQRDGCQRKAQSLQLALHERSKAQLWEDFQWVWETFSSQASGT